MIKKIIFPLIILIIAVVTIFYQFPSLPKNLAYDEVQFAKLALSLDGKPYTPYSQLATGHSTLYFYIILLSFKIFGITNFALRLPAAIFGVLNPLIFYFILKKIFKKFLNFSISQFLNFPFLLSLVFVTSHWYFNFARFSFEATFLLFLELLSLLFLLSYIICHPKGGWKLKLLLSGIFTGLAYNSYTPGRIFFLLPVTILFYQAMRQWNNEALKRLLFFFVPFIIIILPLTVYLFQHPDPRVNQQFFLKNTELSIQKKGEFLASNIVSIVLMFNIKGDVNGRHNYPYKPALNLILGILFLIGIVTAIRQFNNINNKIFLFYFLLSLIPAILTYPWENPNMLRTFTVIPSVIYFIGLALYNSHAAASKLLSFNKKVVVISLIILIFISCIYEIRTYFFYQSRVFPEAFEIRLSLPQAMVKF